MKFSFRTLLLLLCGVLLMSAVSRVRGEEPLRYRIARRPLLLTLCLSALTLAILLFGAYGIGYDASQFIYNQF